MIGEDLRLVPVRDPADPRLAAFRDVRERDLARAGELIAEGRVVLGHLLLSPDFRPAALLVLRARLAGIADLLPGLPADCPVFVAEGAVIDAVAGFPVHRGVLLHARRRAEAPDARALLGRLAEPGGPGLLALGLANHDNAGALFRNAAAFGARFVLLDEGSCDPFYRKSIRVSVGAVFTVPTARVRDGAEALETAKAAGARLLALSPGGRTRLAALRPGPRDVLVIGAEGPGLSAEVLDACETVSIEMAPGLDSLNVATAAAIALHHLHSRRGERER